MNKEWDFFRIWKTGLWVLVTLVFVFMIVLFLHGGRLVWPQGHLILQSLLPLAGGIVLFFALPLLPGPWSREDATGAKWLLRGLVLAAVVAIGGYLRLYQLTALDTPRTIVFVADLITVLAFAYWFRQFQRGHLKRDKLNMVIFGAFLAASAGVYSTWLHITAGAGVTIWLKWQLTVVLLYGFVLSRDVADEE